jgi:pilus assembly protein TadC
LRSGISLLEALETLAEKEARGASVGVLLGLTERLKQGQSFSNALQAFPQAFPDLYVATVRASERTGSLPEALSRYVAYQTQLDSVKKHLVSASIYPAILLIVGGSGVPVSSRLRGAAVFAHLRGHRRRSALAYAHPDCLGRGGRGARWLAARRTVGRRCGR